MTSGREARAARVTVVTSPGCHFCAEAEDVLAQISSDEPLEIVRVDSRSELGVALMQHHRAAMSPLVLLDDQFVSAGRLSRGKFRKLLELRQSAIAGTR